LPFVEEECALAFLPWAHSFGQVCELHALVSIGGAIAINDSIPTLVANLAEVKPTLLFAVPRVFNRVYVGVNEQIGERPGVIRALFRRGADSGKRRAGGAQIGSGVRIPPPPFLFRRTECSCVSAYGRHRSGRRLVFSVAGA
jgi:long-chain acyl-CoA synthetase